MDDVLSGRALTSRTCDAGTDLGFERLLVFRGLRLLRLVRALRTKVFAHRVAEARIMLAQVVWVSNQHSGTDRACFTERLRRKLIIVQDLYLERLVMSTF